VSQLLSEVSSLRRPRRRCQAIPAAGDGGIEHEPTEE
jgi:hypothetical protein